MMWIKYLVFVGIIAVVYADDSDIFCYSKEIASKCSTSEYTSDPCSPTNNLVLCVSTSALSCSVATDKDIQDLIVTLTQTCTPGTELYKGFKEHGSCVIGAVSGSGCNKDLSNALAGLDKKLPVDKFMREAFKLSCKFNDTVTNCNIEAVKKGCGEEAEKFVKLQQTDARNRISKRLCDYVNSAFRNYFQLPMWVLQGAIVVFIYKWSSY